MTKKLTLIDVFIDIGMIKKTLPFFLNCLLIASPLFAASQKRLLIEIVMLFIAILFIIIIGIFFSYLFLFMIEEKSKSKKWLGYLFSIAIVCIVIVPPLISGNPTETKEAFLLIGIIAMLGLFERLIHKKIKLHPLLASIFWLWIFLYVSFLIFTPEDTFLMNTGIFFSLFLIINYFTKLFIDKKALNSRFSKVFIAVIYFAVICGIFVLLNGHYTALQ